MGRISISETRDMNGSGLWINNGHGLLVFSHNILPPRKVSLSSMALIVGLPLGLMTTAWRAKTLALGR